MHFHLVLAGICWFITGEVWPRPRWRTQLFWAEPWDMAAIMASARNVWCHSPHHWRPIPCSWLPLSLSFTSIITHCCKELLSYSVFPTGSAFLTNSLWLRDQETEEISDPSPQQNWFSTPCFGGGLEEFLPWEISRVTNCLLHLFPQRQRRDCPSHFRFQQRWPK